MRVIPELKRIAGCRAKMARLAEKAEEKLDLEGLGWQEAELISGCRVKGKHLYQNGVRLDNCGLVDDLYYCEQHTGYCEDDFYGTLYFATDVPGQYVAVPFSM